MSEDCDSGTSRSDVNPAPDVIDDPVIHLLCVDCMTAVVAASIAAQERVPRWPRCPVCGADGDKDTWRPVSGTADALRSLSLDYDTVAVDLDTHDVLEVDHV